MNPTSCQGTANWGMGPFASHLHSPLLSISFLPWLCASPFHQPICNVTNACRPYQAFFANRRAPPRTTMESWWRGLHHLCFKITLRHHYYSAWHIWNAASVPCSQRTETAIFVAVMLRKKFKTTSQTFREDYGGHPYLDFFQRPSKTGHL